MNHGLLRFGIAGLGGAGNKMLPNFDQVEGVELAAAADLRPEARSAFENAHNCPAFSTVRAMCRSNQIDAVYVATPNHLHCEHTIEATGSGKHVICEKPLATTLADCHRMIASAEETGVLLLQGYSKVFDAPIRAMRSVINSGRLGDVIQVDTWNFNDWMRRPRLEAELQTEKGGGVVFRQAPQQVDIVRYLMGGMPQTVRGVTGRWEKLLPTEGNFSALMTFEGRKCANLTFNGYGFFDIDEITTRSPSRTSPRPRRNSSAAPAEKYAEESSYRARRATSFCGLTIVSCERGVMRQSPQGLYVYTDDGCEEIMVPEERGRAAALIELRDAIRDGREVFPDGAWARATLEVCLAILDSSASGRDVPLKHQTKVSDT